MNCNSNNIDQPVVEQKPRERKERRTVLKLALVQEFLDEKLITRNTDYIYNPVWSAKLLPTIINADGLVWPAQLGRLSAV